MVLGFISIVALSLVVKDLLSFMFLLLLYISFIESYIMFICFVLKSYFS